MGKKVWRGQKPKENEVVKELFYLNFIAYHEFLIKKGAASQTINIEDIAKEYMSL